MRPFEVYDCVALKRNLSFAGSVRRTHNEGNESFDEELVIAHVYVSPDALNEFITTGIPPPGYLFVKFACPTRGSSLIHQDDLVLTSRAFRLGDRVRRHGSPLTGTVVNVEDSYILAPIEIDTPALSLPNHPTCTSGCPNLLPEHVVHSNPHMLLYDVPAREITRAQDVTQDDYIIMGNWVGLVYELDYDVVIMLEDGAVVVVTGPYGLHIPVPDHGKPLVAVPDYDGSHKLNAVEETRNLAATIPVVHPRPGEFVIIDRSRLRYGRWISGAYDKNVPARGVIMDSRARDVSVDWMSNRTPENSHNLASMPRDEIEIYTDPKKFRDSASLKRRKDVIIYDLGQIPLGNTPAMDNQAGSGPSSRPVDSEQQLGIGVRVKFRDTTAAAVKYQGINGTTHGKFDRIPIEASRGWDLNEFDIVHELQHATVLWQDGTITTSDSTTTLSGFTLFEADIAPTDIVLKRQGMRQRPVGDQGAKRSRITDFNEMIFFERPHDLLPASVGVVQSVDPTERVARVRWYKEPRIVLYSAGQQLSTDSYFGPMGDVVEDVSLYEIMTFPSLQRQRGDMCVISGSGESKAERLKRRRKSTTERPTLENATSTESPNPPELSSGPSRRRLRARIERAVEQPPATAVSSLPREADWIGQIVAINLDGSITVRLGGLDPVRDVSVSADAIIAIIDNEGYDEPDSEDMMDLDSWMDSGSEWSNATPEPIEETVEYEGGQRIDNDSGDENWLSDGEEVFEDAKEVLQDQDGDVQMSEEAPQQTGILTSQPEKLRVNLRLRIDSEPPPQFLVSDRLPPVDQFGLHSSQTAATSLKRIAKEHKILASSLPEGEIYVRTYENRLDLFRCLIIGPKDTPYEHAPFLIDLYLPPGFPEEPPTAHFHSWTSGLGRINPNLYEEGKICLSLLGTWSGKDDSEKWSPKATILQLLVSLQGLVFVKKPFYNEAGFEGYENDKAYTRESEQYSEKAFVMSHGFVKYALTRPPAGLEDILAWLYLPRDDGQSSKGLLSTVVERGKVLLERSDEARARQDDSLLDASGNKGDETTAFLKPLSRGASVMLRRSLGELEALLAHASIEKGKP